MYRSSQVRRGEPSTTGLKRRPQRRCARTADCYGSTDKSYYKPKSWPFQARNYHLEWLYGRNISSVGQIRVGDCPGYLVMSGSPVCPITSSRPPPKRWPLVARTGQRFPRLKGPRQRIRYPARSGTLPTRWLAPGPAPRLRWRLIASDKPWRYPAPKGPSRRPMDRRM